VQEHALHGEDGPCRPVAQLAVLPEASRRGGDEQDHPHLADLPASPRHVRPALVFQRPRTAGARRADLQPCVAARRHADVFHGEPVVATKRVPPRLGPGQDHGGREVAPVRLVVPVEGGRHAEPRAHRERLPRPHPQELHGVVAGPHGVRPETKAVVGRHVGGSLLEVAGGGDDPAFPLERGRREVVLEPRLRGRGCGEDKGGPEEPRARTHRSHPASGSTLRRPDREARSRRPFRWRRCRKRPCTAP